VAWPLERAWDSALISVEEDVMWDAGGAGIRYDAVVCKGQRSARSIQVTDQGLDKEGSGR
jgi:hypothetical protein